jgi:23S rRNA (uracil1939-C5)-methyltransferase
MGAAGDMVEVEIAALGARGDGIAERDGQRLFVPFSVPGDRLRVRIGDAEGDGLRATIVERLADGSGRRAPVCRHFASCGGCVAQHLGDAAYGAWKTGMAADALARCGFDRGLVAPLRRIAPGTRRRARLKARRAAEGVSLGFFAPASHRVVDLAECPVLAPPLVALLPALRAALGGVLGAGEGCEAAVTLTATGIDLVLALGRPANTALRSRLAAFAEAADLARLSVRQTGRRGGPAPPAEPVAARRPVQVSFGAVPVDLPPDAFLQPTAEGERFLAAAVVEALAGRKRVADLFSGCGAFALPLLAAGCHVHAADSAGDHVLALEGAARRAGLGAQLAAGVRDLARRPLAVADLAGLGGMVLDPPRPGAPAQARALAESPVPVVVYVSCNPASFARDARTLADGGYALEAVTPLDQFVFSPHLELVGIFTKEAGKRRRR